MRTSVRVLCVADRIEKESPEGGREDFRRVTDIRGLEGMALEAALSFNVALVTELRERGVALWDE